MSDPKEIQARIPARVHRTYSRGPWHAYAASISSHGVMGEGNTEREARDDLEKNLLWIAHYVGAFVALDGVGQPWIVTVAAWHGHWIVRRATDTGMSTGSTVMAAPSYSRVIAEIATWNAPQEGSAA